MKFFFLGLILGSFLGISLAAMMIKSKEADERSFGLREEKDGVAKECIQP